MLTLNNITRTLDEKTNTDDTVVFEICEENQHVNSTKWLMDNTEINNPDNVNIFDWIYNYLINKYGRIENAITKNGMENACINRNVIIENQPVFNIELPESKRYHQEDSMRCWIYGGLNLIKHNIAQNLNIDIMDLELSNNYIAFFDKLEKSNNAYENIIN